MAQKKSSPIGLLILAATLFSQTGCQSSTEVEDPVVATVYAPRHASGFRIDSLESGRKRLVVTRPWQGATGEEMIFDLDSAYSRLAAMSATHIAMLSELEKDDLIVAASSLKYVFNKRVRERLNDRTDFGYEGNIDYERLLSTSPELALIYSTGGKSSMEGKLREIGIPYIYIADYTEEEPLGKAEWLVALGELTGDRQGAEVRFEQIESEYIKEKSRAIRSNQDSKPGVMVNAPYGDSWFCPPDSSYAVTLIREAGGNYLLPEIKGNASKPIDMERAVQLGEKADIWLNPGNVSSLEELRKNVPKLKDSRVLNGGRVYSNNRRVTKEGGNDYFETGTVRPDLVLKDLRLIMTDNDSDSTLYFYKRLD